MRSLLMVFVSVGLASLLVGLAAVTSPGDGNAGDSQTRSGEDEAEPDPLEQIDALIQGGQYGIAQDRARKLLANVESEHGKLSVPAAQVMDLLVESLYRGGKASEPECLHVALQALEIKEDRLDPQDPDLSYTLTNLAEVHRLTGRIAEARPLLERALAIQEAAFGPDDLAVAKGLHNLATLLSDMGRFTEARPLYERELVIMEKANRPEHLAAGLYSLARLLRREGEYSDAGATYARALQVAKEGLGEVHPLVAWISNGYASLLDDTGDYARAREYYEQALTIAKKTVGPEHPFVASCLNNLAYNLRSIGDYETARATYEEALALTEKTRGPDNTYTAGTLNNLAELLQLMGQFNQAKPLFERALAIQEQIHDEPHPDVAGGLQDLGLLLAETGDLAGAMELYRRAAKIWKETVGPDHPDLAFTLDRMATLLEKTGEQQEARSLFEQALAIREESLGTEHPLVAVVLNNLAALLAWQQHTTESFDMALRAEKIGREHFLLTASTLPERQALGYAGTRTRSLDLAVSLRVARTESPGIDAVWDAVVRSRALVLDEMASRNRAPGASGDPDLASLAATLASARRRLANLTVRGPDRDHPELYREQLDERRLEKEAAERALASRSTEFRKTRDSRDISLDAVRKSVPAATALVAFLQYRHEPLPQAGAAGAGEQTPHPALETEPLLSYVAFALTGADVSPIVVPLGSAADIDELVSRWTEQGAHGLLAGSVSSEQAEADYRDAGTRLRRKIWDPVAGRLGSLDRVFIVPDGAVHLVNIAALPAADGGYLIESGPLFHYLATERDLVTLQAPRQTGEGLLALGGPAFDDAPTADEPPAPAGARPPGAGSGVAPTFRGNRSGCSHFQSIRFSSLPAAAEEAGEIVSLWEKTFPDSKRVDSAAGSGEIVHLFERNASEARFKSEAPGKRVLHLATHGFFLDGRCPSAGSPRRGIGGLGPVSDPPPPAPDVENPLLLSGFALAGANLRAGTAPEQEDGILTAEEIASMDLSGVEWAVLSACDTGSGQVRAGEGVFGLRRAFDLAGAATVIMNLWPVEDTSAREWMKNLYQGHLRRGLETAEAARQASLALLRERRKEEMSTHPFFWGGWMVAGDWH